MTEYRKAAGFWLKLALMPIKGGEVYGVGHESPPYCMGGGSLYHDGCAIERSPPRCMGEGRERLFLARIDWSNISKIN